MASMVLLISSNRLVDETFSLARLAWALRSKFRLLSYIRYVRFSQSRPSNSSDVLEVQTVDVFELLHVRVVACDDSDRRDGRAASSKQQNVTGSRLLNKATPRTY